MTISYQSFKKRADIFSFEYLKCIIYLIDTNSAENEILTKKLYSQLISASHLLEDFLDFHGAKNNRDWFFYRELSATMRHLALSAYSQKHILNRLGSYEFKTDDKIFKKESCDTLVTIQNFLQITAPVILKQAKKLKIFIPEIKYKPRHFPDIATGECLEHNIDNFDNKDQQKKNIINIASNFLELIEKFEKFAFYEKYNKKKIKELVPLNVNEVEIRRFEMLLHNLQSAFDSYVIPSGYQSNKKLKQLRSHFSIVFHILQVMGRLLHFYERHLHNIEFKDVYKNVSETLIKLVNPDILLNRAVNYCLFYAWQFLSSGKKLTFEILDENINRSSIKVGIPQKRGFHTRPSLLVAKIVNHYGGEVKMLAGKGKFDASSVLDIQWAGGKIKKENIQQVIFKGDSRSLIDLKILAKVNYGEDSIGKDVPLPNELSYLR